MYTATKEFNFEAGHCLDGHKGKCKNLHGHNYKVFVTLKSQNLDNMDMVMDFYDLKKFADPLFDKFDHAFLYNSTCIDSFETEIFNVCINHNRKIFSLPMRFTAENMAKYFYSELKRHNDKVYEVTVYETPTSYATYKEGIENAD